jgi:hypothetical protein
VEVARDYWSRTGAAGGIGAVLDSAIALATALDGTPPCFIHGDCHVGNLLRDRNRFLWTDWQVAGIESPAIDIAFLWFRANIDGADVPYEAMLQEYAAHRTIDLDLLRHAVVSAELGFLLFGFPPYAGLHTQEDRDRVTRRLLRLLPDWRADP